MFVDNRVLNSTPLLATGVAVHDGFHNAALPGAAVVARWLHVHHEAASSASWRYKSRTKPLLVLHCDSLAVVKGFRPGFPSVHRALLNPQHQTTLLINKALVDGGNSGTRQSGRVRPSEKHSWGYS